MPKKTTKTAAPKKQTKTAYVLSLPRTLSAKEVVAKGKAAGISLSDAHVYAIRSAKKRKAGGKATKTSHQKRTAHATPKKNHGGHKAESLLKAVASELGLSNAMAILEAEHKMVQRLMGG